LGEWSGVSPFDRLRSGQWLFLCGPHPTSTDQAPRFVANWYQVMAIDSEGAGIINNPNRQRVVTLRGPRWPWQPSTTAGDLSNNLCVGIFPGAVAVHTKTLRLEGRRGGSWGGDTAWGTGQTQQPQGPQSPWPLLNAP
jgi:hypothetical protein